MNTWHLARGYRFAGVSAGIRTEGEPRLDLALVLSDVPATSAGVFTQNRVAAAPVQLCKQRVPNVRTRGVVICSGNANACTGEQGLADALRMAQLAAQVTGAEPEQWLVASTGVIGRTLPMPKIEKGIHAAGQHLEASPKALKAVAEAITTTDTRIKVVTRQLELAGRSTTLTGFAKGAAMIGPNMATLLAFVCTDANVAPVDLQRLTSNATQWSFNAISVEGHTSTNDTLLVLANGAAGGPQLFGEALSKFEAALTAVCTDLAKEIARDAEGAAHFVTLTVEGCRDDLEAKRIAKTVAESALVKTAIYGADPNWGRFVSAAGYAGVPFEEKHLSLWLGDLLLYQHGTPQPFDINTASAYLKQNREVHLRFRFTLGSGQCTFWTSDLTVDYVKLNADYTT